MRVVVQRTKESSVEVDKKIVGKIDRGLTILVGFTEGDNLEILKYMVKKIVNLRIFDDESGIMNKSILDVSGSILSISQFTLYGDTKKGNRPSYVKALNGDVAIELYKMFNLLLREYVPVEEGIFGSDMKVSLVNDGPVTIIIEKECDNNEK